MNLIMEQFMKASGLKKAFVMVKVSKSGKMEANTKAIGKTIWLTVVVV
jgi:hypothetical protein